MDLSTYKKLLERFVQMVDRTDLQSDLPDQFRKHWDNYGQSGTVQIFRVRLLDQPCEINFSLFFDKDEVIQTGIQIKFKGDEIINEVRKGDVLNYKSTQRIDPIAFLKENFGSLAAAADPASHSPSESFTLAVDDDSEAQVFRSVEQLTGKSQAELKTIWAERLSQNSRRFGKDQVSPIIKTWLKKERDILDITFLRDAELLQPRPLDVLHFSAHNRSYTVVCKNLRGHLIREKIDNADPEWWGGTFYALSQDLLTRIPHDHHDRLRCLKSFSSAFEFPIEEIFIDNRHIYSVVFVGQEALVWRTRDQVSPDFLPEPVAEPDPGKITKLMSRLKRQPAPTPETAPEPEDTQQTAGNRFVLTRTENAYIKALRDKTPDLNSLRKEYLQLLYDSEPWRFQNNPEELRAEIDGALAQAFPKNPTALQRESALLDAHITIFYADRQP